MQPIPPYLRGFLAEQPRMKKCAMYPLDFGDCDGRIEWEHPWIYASKQINEVWAIIGLCKKHHKEKDQNPRLRAAIQLHSLNLASTDDIAKYSRKDWNQERRHLQALSTPIDKPLAF